MDDPMVGEMWPRVKVLHTHVTCKLSLQNDFFTKAWIRIVAEKPNILIPLTQFLIYCEYSQEA